MFSFYRNSILDNLPYKNHDYRLITDQATDLNFIYTWNYGTFFVRYYDESTYRSWNNHSLICFKRVSLAEFGNLLWTIFQKYSSQQ